MASNNDGRQQQPMANCAQCGKPTEKQGSLCEACLTGNAPTLAPASTESTARSSSLDQPTELPDSSTKSTSPSLSNQFGEYELLEEIARGGMGVVFKARHQKLNRITALKMVLGGRFSSEEELQRFHIEAESAARLDHPGIVPVYEIGEEDGQPFFAMKYIPGGSLADHMHRLCEQPKQAMQLLAQVARAVHHAHQRGVLHRDLKPANILIDEEGSPLITDLGLAKSTSGDSNLTNTGAVMGTPAYMPPEQASGGTVTTAADIYSLGAILYQLLVGEPPHQGSTAMETVMKVVKGPPAPPSDIKKDVDRSLEAISMKCLEFAPEQRYSTCLASRPGPRGLVRRQTHQRQGNLSPRKNQTLVSGKQSLRLHRLHRAYRVPNQPAVCTRLFLVTRRLGEHLLAFSSGRSTMALFLRSAHPWLAVWNHHLFSSPIVLPFNWITERCFLAHEVASPRSPDRIIHFIHSGGHYHPASRLDPGGWRIVRTVFACHSSSCERRLAA